ncbi:hypothetical protein BDW59DRAFT_166073 [Aspergillus cavernicola]|uniref:Uncharacterized protein n=1 Tax=Aspergillus cavernicola TaxID=176166 RepID=A0ABR4HNI0_9EURO
MERPQQPHHKLPPAHGAMIPIHKHKPNTENASLDGLENVEFGIPPCSAVFVLPLLHSSLVLVGPRAIITQCSGYHDDDEACNVGQHVVERVGDYKATNGLSHRGRHPRRRNHRAVGEIKTPCIHQHRLVYAVQRGGEDLSKTLGQVANYMRLAILKYSFVSTYQQTVFVKQEVRNGVWTLVYTDVVPGSNVFINTSDGVDMSMVTLRECFWYFVHLVEQNHAANNTLPAGEWAIEAPS